MKRILLTSLFLASAIFTSQAQNWNLFSLPAKFNYQEDGADFVTTTIQPKEAALVGVDSMFFMPRRGVLVNANAMLIGSIFGDTMVKHPNSEYEFRFSPAPDYPYALNRTVIRTLAEPDDFWEIEPGVIATVVEKKDSTLWGIADSIKHLLLSDGSRITLSKKFGLLYYKNNRLVGVEGKNIGIQLPTLDQFYTDWIPGAVFETETKSTSKYYTSETWKKYYVLDQFVSADSLKIRVRELSRVETRGWGTSQINVQFKDQTKDLYAGNIKSRWEPGITQSMNSSNLFFNTKYIQTPDGLQLDTGYIHTFNVGSGFHQTSTYQQGLGQVYHFEEVAGGGTYSSSTTNLTGYRRAGESTNGAIHSDEFYVPVDSSVNFVNPNILKENFLLYPNPVSGGILKFVNNDSVAVSQIDLYNIEGKLAKTIVEPASLTALVVSDLADGMYILQILWADGRKKSTRIFIR